MSDSEQRMWKVVCVINSGDRVKYRLHNKSFNVIAKSVEEAIQKVKAAKFDLDPVVMSVNPMGVVHVP